METSNNTSNPSVDDRRVPMDLSYRNKFNRYKKVPHMIS